VAVKDVVAEDQRDVILADEVAPDNEGVGNPAGIVLRGVGKAAHRSHNGLPPLMALSMWRRQGRRVGTDLRWQSSVG
jgi:hypothetical protein